MVAEFNTTVNGAHPANCFNISGYPAAERIGKTLGYCFLLVVSLLGNCFIGVIVYRKKTMRKTINFLIVNMAMSDLIYPIFVFPQILTELHIASWLTSGSLRNSFCTVDVYLEYVSAAVSIQTLVLIAVDRFVAVVFPLRSPLFGSKMCFCLILITWVRSPCCNFRAYVPHRETFKGSRSSKRAVLDEVE